MPKLDLLRSTPVKRSARVLQLEGLFEIPPTRQSELRWSVNLPLEESPWHVGLIVGPSGSGKSTVAREVFGKDLVGEFDWSGERSIVDDFPAKMGVKDITALLSSVGFSSPPAWLRPFRVLSTGEQFRVTLARAMADERPLIVFDEFTSVVDRTVAQVGSAAVAKAIRRLDRKLIAVTCHYDVEEWLDPDWVLEMPNAEFRRRSLQGRPRIDLSVTRVPVSAWQLFKQHHYLNTSLHAGARCFAAFWRDRPVAFASCLHSPGRVCAWREHRTVCLPDFQGVGIGNALSEFVAGVMMASTGKPYYSVTSNPAMIRHRARSPIWNMHRTPQLSKPDSAKPGRFRRSARALIASRSVNRLVAGFRYVGPARPDDARRLGLSA